MGNAVYSRQQRRASKCELPGRHLQARDARILLGSTLKTLQQKVFHPFLIGMKKPRCIVHRGFHDDSLYQLFALSILCLVFALLFFAFFQNRFGIYRSRSKRTTVLREYLELFSGLKPDMKLGD